MKTLIEIHALQNFAPSNLNRDDTGAPKDALFGGTRRARVSSQCLKRAVREYFKTLQAEGLFGPDELGVRTKRIYQDIADRLAGKRDHAEALAKAEVALTYVKLKADKEGKTEYLLFLGQAEVAALADAIHQYWDQIVPAVDEDSAKSKGKGKKSKAGDAPKEVKERIETILDGGKAVDVALFGRMLADMPKKNQNAACQVAHAISTHAVEREFDFYTAVDDLKPDDTAGADMMGTVEFNSACFYRYAVVDWEKLVKNLQGDRELATKGVRGFVEGFVVSEPTGKQNTFAAHNPPELVAVSVRRDTAPRNLANAFETAIVVRKGESLTRRSAEELIRKGNALQAAFGGEGSTFALNLTGASLEGFAADVSSLKELLDQGLSSLQG